MIKCSFFFYFPASQSQQLMESLQTTVRTFGLVFNFPGKKIFLASNFHITGLIGPLFWAKVHAAQKKIVQKLRYIFNLEFSMSPQVSIIFIFF